MADISEKLRQIKAMVDEGQYFTINRARQYGKTTTLNALERILEDDYVVIHLDFQLLGNADFETEPAFVAAFSSELLENMAYIPEEIRGRLSAFADDGPGRGKHRDGVVVVSNRIFETRLYNYFLATSETQDSPVLTKRKKSG